MGYDGFNKYSHARQTMGYKTIVWLSMIVVRASRIQVGIQNPVLTLQDSYKEGRVSTKAPAGAMKNFERVIGQN